MTPSSRIVATATTESIVSDATGRRIVVRRLTALDKLRLFKAAGPLLSQNEPWLGMALLAYSTVAIDEVPVPIPSSEVQIEATVARLGDAGISAVAAALSSDLTPLSTEAITTAGN